MQFRRLVRVRTPGSGSGRSLGLAGFRRGPSSPRQPVSRPTAAVRAITSCSRAAPGPPAFVVDADFQASQQGDWLGVAPRSLAQARRRCFHGDGGHAPGVVGDHLVTVCGCDHQDLGRTGGCRLPREAAQPLRLFLRATLEGVHYVVAGQKDGWQVADSHSATKGDGRCISSRSPGRSRRGRALIASHASAASGDRKNSVRSARTWREAVVTLLRTNAVTLVPAAATARSMSARSSGVALTSDTLTAAAVLVSLHCSANVRRGTARRHLPLSVLLVRIPPTQCAGL